MSSLVKDLSFDRTRIGLLKDLSKRRRFAVAYQFQYTENRAGQCTPQHAIFLRYWFGRLLSARGRGADKGQ